MTSSLALLGTVTAVHLLAVISPGPDFVMCVRNSLTYSRKTGIWTAVGIGAGIAVHILYCIAGLALVVSRSILVFNALKFLGAGYLIYIGFKSFFSKSSAIDTTRCVRVARYSGVSRLSKIIASTARERGRLQSGFARWRGLCEPLSNGGQARKVDISALAAFRIGFLTNVLNPKATLFFLSLFTLVISPSTPLPILAVASVIMIFNTALWFSCVAVFMTQGKIRAVFEKFQGAFNKTLGGILMALGIKVALTER